MIEAVVAESLVGNYRDKLDFLDGTGTYFEPKKTKQTKCMTQIQENSSLKKKIIHWQFYTILWLSNVQFSYSI